MPKWIWLLPAKVLTHSEKHFLAYIWYCGPKGAHSWNWRLARLFSCSKRTIRRRIEKLSSVNLIHLGHPQDRGRTIWANPYYQPAVWLNKCGLAGLSTKDLTARVIKQARWTYLSTISNAQQNNKYKTTYYSSADKKAEPSQGDERVLNFSSAEGLGGSRPAEVKLSTVMRELYGDLVLPRLAPVEKV